MDVSASGRVSGEEIVAVAIDAPEEQRALLIGTPRRGVVMVGSLALQNDGVFSRELRRPWTLLASLSRALLSQSARRQIPLLQPSSGNALVSYDCEARWSCAGRQRRDRAGGAQHWRPAKMWHMMICVFASLKARRGEKGKLKRGRKKAGRNWAVVCLLELR